MAPLECLSSNTKSSDNSCTYPVMGLREMTRGGRDRYTTMNGSSLLVIPNNIRSMGVMRCIDMRDGHHKQSVDGKNGPYRTRRVIGKGSLECRGILGKDTLDWEIRELLPQA